LTAQSELANGEGTMAEKGTTGWRRLAPLLAAALLAACVPEPPPAPEAAGPVVVDITASTATNPDAAGRASPVGIRLYLLRTPDAFRIADYFALTDDPQGTLGDSLVESSELFVSPGAAVSRPLDLPPGAAFVGIAAGFRNIDGAQWRAVVPASGHIAVALDGQTVTVAGS
jgi:type VI secretion system protein VasD